MNINKSPRRIDRKAGGRNKKIIIKNYSKANYEKNQKSSLIAFNDDFNNLDKKLELLIKERNTLLDKKNQFALNKERINNSLKITFNNS